MPDAEVFPLQRKVIYTDLQSRSSQFFLTCFISILASILFLQPLGKEVGSCMLLRCSHSSVLVCAQGRGREPFLATCTVLEEEPSHLSVVSQSSFSFWIIWKSINAEEVWEWVRIKGAFWFSMTGCWLRSCQSQWVFYHSQMVGQEVPLGLSDGKLRLQVGLETNEQTRGTALCISLIITKITQWWGKEGKYSALASPEDHHKLESWV